MVHAFLWFTWGGRDRHTLLCILDCQDGASTTRRPWGPGQLLAVSDGERVWRVEGFCIGAKRSQDGASGASQSISPRSFHIPLCLAELDPSRDPPSLSLSSMP